MRTIGFPRWAGERPIAALCGLNFFLADVRDGLGPYLAVYLLTVHRWTEAGTGLALSVSGFAGLAAQTPVGAWIDATRRKRMAIALAALAVAFASGAVARWPNFWIVIGGTAIMGVAATVFPPALAAMTRGLLRDDRQFTRQIGRNEAFNHAGNAAAATSAGLFGTLVAPVAVFWQVAVMAALSIGTVFAIPARAIDHDRARGLDRDAADDARRPSGWRVLVECRPLLVFAGLLMLFHLANAAMLPLVGQKLALQDKRAGMAFMSACIVAAQIVMVPAAILVGKRAERWGRKPLLLIAFGILPVRGVLYTFSNHPAWLIAVQALDGVGAGLLGALFPIVISDLTGRTGRYNVAQGAVATAQGIGASASAALAGWIVVRAGYRTAFLTLAGLALTACALMLLLMPETRPEAERSASARLIEEPQAG